MHIPILLVVIVLGVFALPTFLEKFLPMRGGSSVLPYVKKEYLMTNAEREFFKVLHLAVQDKYYIVPQVQLSNLVQVKKGEWDYKHKNKINLKSVDFVLFDKKYFTPQIVI